MGLKVKRMPYEWYMIVGMLIISGIFLGLGIYGTYYASPETKEFYAYYIIVTVSSIIIGNIIVPLLQRPASDFLMQETNKQIDNLTKAMSSANSLGFSHIASNMNEIDWGLMINEAREIKLVFKSNVKWMSDNKDSLLEFLEKRNSCIMVVLPDISSDGLCGQLALQRNESVDHIKRDVEGAVTIIKELHASAPGKVHLKMTNTVFVSHFYIFSSKSVVTIRTINRWRSPHIICDGADPNRDRLHKFCCDQFEELWKTRSKSVALS